MSKGMGKQTWVAPKLEQIAMVDTNIKGENQSENINTNMFMTATGMAS